METMAALYMIGTAGCGKSTLTASMGQWLAGNGYTVNTLNLDPGADVLPYEPDVDVRDWITLGDVMEEYGLGPNGAQVVAADMIALYKKRIIEEIDQGEYHYLLIDTPGQLELFSFREATRDIVRSLRPGGSALIYLIDPFNARFPSGYISQLMLANLSKLRFQLPSIEVLAKYDMVDPPIKERLDRWQTYPEQLLNDLLEESSTSADLGPELSVGMFRSLESMDLFSSHVPVSARNGDGMERIVQTVQLMFGGGENPTGSSGKDPFDDPEE